MLFHVKEGAGLVVSVNLVEWWDTGGAMGLGMRLGSPVSEWVMVLIGSSSIDGVDSVDWAGIPYSWSEVFGGGVGWTALRCWIGK
jgi:hypothetical protein